MYTVRIRQHMMIAHSLPSEAFGPAQKMHGATYIVDAEFSKSELDENNIVIDIDIATKVLKKALSPLNYQNLDELDIFRGRLTTTEFLAAHIHEAICKEMKGDFDGQLKITLGESHVAWASYQAPLL